MLWRNLGPPCGWPMHGCAAGCALVSRFLVMIHCLTAPMCYFHVSSSLVISLYLIEDPYIRSKVVELPFEVTKRISFEELVTDINNNRLQEVVNKRLYLTVPVMTLIVWWATYVIHVGSERYPALNVGQVINLMIMDGDILWCNRSPGAHEPPVQVLDL